MLRIASLEALVSLKETRSGIVHDEVVAWLPLTVDRIGMRSGTGRYVSQ